MTHATYVKRWVQGGGRFQLGWVEGVWEGVCVAGASCIRESRTLREEFLHYGVVDVDFHYSSPQIAAVQAP